MGYVSVPERPLAISSVLIVDDHPLYSDALGQALQLTIEGCDVSGARTLTDALSLVADGLSPDLVMFDLKLPDVTGISGFKALREALPDTKILVISSLASFDLVQSLLDLGAVGFMPKDTSAQGLQRGLAQIMAGKRFIPAEYRHPAVDASKSNEFDHPKLADLTPQQQRIMRLICRGKPNKQIAYELSLAEATIKAHITALLRRLGVSNRTQAVVLVEEALAEQLGDEPEARAFLRR
ncbi:MAG: response regulator transcription factor [Sulfitobacter sp.]|jgi:DNA-binding NarL/FixJ family response regulator